MWYDFGSYARLLNTSPYLQPGTAVETPDSKRRIMNLLAATSMLDHLELIASKAVPFCALAIYQFTLCVPVIFEQAQTYLI